MNRPLQLARRAPTVTGVSENGKAPSCGAAAFALPCVFWRERYLAAAAISPGGKILNKKAGILSPGANGPVP